MSRTTVLRWLGGSVRILGSQHLAVRGLLGGLPNCAGREPSKDDDWHAGGTASTREEAEREAAHYLGQYANDDTGMRYEVYEVTRKSLGGLTCRGGTMNEPQVQELKELLLAEEQDNPPVLWWMSFCDPEKPKGQQFLGVCIVEAPGFIHAYQKAWALGINPGGEIQAAQVEGIPGEYMNKLLSSAELKAAGLV